MPRSLPTDLRWRVVFKLLYDEKTFDQVAEELSAGPLVVDPRWVRRMWDLFCEAGDVADVQGQRFAEPANKKLPFVREKLRSRSLMMASYLRVHPFVLP